MRELLQNAIAWRALSAGLNAGGCALTAVTLGSPLGARGGVICGAAVALLIGAGMTAALTIWETQEVAARG